MTVKEYIEASVRLSDEHIKAVERLKEKLEELLADIEEQHEPTEPLIKDEKIRKAVRAWAELNCSHKLHQFNDYQLEDENDYLIEFADSCFTNLKIGKNYTITELCGEEEE